MGKTYRNPSISEVICEFRFAPSTPWDITIPGMLFGVLKDSFPIKEKRNAKNIQIIAGPNGPEQSVTVVEQIIFFSEDRRSLVLVGQNILSINHLAPYPGWHNFFPLIDRVFTIYRGMVAPIVFERIGLRYLNIISLSNGPNKLSHYFDFHPHIGKDLPQDFMSFLTGCIFPFNMGSDMCKVELTNAAPKNPSDRTMLLDLDYSTMLNHPVEVTNVSAWLNVAHENIERMFEGCIKDPVREILGNQ